LLALKKPEDAKKALDPIVAQAGLSAEFKALYGMSLYSLNNVLDAEPWLAGALKDEPSRVDVLVPLAAAAMQRRDYPAAARYLESASKTASQDLTWLVLKSQYALEYARQSDAESFCSFRGAFVPQRLLWQSLSSFWFCKSPTIRLGTWKPSIWQNVVLDLTKGHNAYSTPLEQAQRTWARNVGFQFLVSESYRRQDWLSAANYLQQAGSAALDKEMVATILRKSGDVQAAVQFSSSWYAQEPTSEKAVEAYLRSLAMATGGGLASAAPASDAPTGLGIALSALGVNQGGSTNSAMLDMVVKFIAAPFSKELKFVFFIICRLLFKMTRI